MANFKKVTKGTVWTPDGVEHNAFIDAALAHKNRRHDLRAPGTKEFRQADIVKVENASGYDVDRFDVLGIDGPIFTPDENLTEFSNRLALRGITPDIDVHRGRFLVMLEPIADGKIGRAWVSGTCQARVDLVNDDHQFCEAVDGDRSQLVSCHDGSARILWHEDRDGSGGASNGLAVIRIGDAAPRIYVGRFAGTWTKGTTASVELCEWNGSGYVVADPAHSDTVYNGLADVSTPDEYSPGLVHYSFRGGMLTMDAFECDVPQVGS